MLLSSYHEKNKKDLCKDFLMIFSKNKAFFVSVDMDLDPVPDPGPGSILQVLFPSTYGSTTLSPPLICTFFYRNIAPKPRPVMFFKMNLDK